jgi:signal transduction histidine kinase
MIQVRGLPIAAYLGALVALALTAAFVAVLAVVIWLPPRPPDVMRADEVADHFQSGYDFATAEGRTLPNDNMSWRIQRDEPVADQPVGLMSLTQWRLAHSLDLDPDQVRIMAEQVTRNDTFVFRVRDVEALHEGMEEAAREMESAIRDAERQSRAAESSVREAERVAEEADKAARNAERAAREAMRSGLEIDNLLEAEADARAQAAEARSAVDEAREVEREAREAERALRLERARMSAGEFDPSIAPDVKVEVWQGESGAIQGFEFVPEAPAPPNPPSPASGVLAPDAAAPVAPVAPEAPDVVFAPAPDGVMLISGFSFAAQLPDGRWLVMEQGRNWAEIGWIARAATIIGATLLVLSLLAVAFARRLTLPIRNFSQAVQAVGVDPQNAPVREEGPLELRSAAQAVNTMQARLRALIADRTKTLAAVAHDMRTPLMRLRLAAENVAPEQRDRMAKEIEEVEALVASFIAFARDDPAEEARVRLDLTALLQSLADDQIEAGRNVAFSCDERVVITGQSLGLKRLFSNLVENALRYGGCARLSLWRDGDQVVVDVADEGPGIPVEQRESVFEPFVRLENGEAKSAHGAGLGLPAARSIARAHGGDVAVVDAERGALFRVTLPA